MTTNLYEKILSWHNDNKSVVFTDAEVVDRNRVLYTLEVLLEKKGLINHNQIFERVRSKFDVSINTCMRDIVFCERFIGNERNPDGDAQKVFYRYFIIENAKDALFIAKEKRDTYAMQNLLNLIGKYTNADIPDTHKLPFERILPPDPVYTTDVTVLGYKAAPKGLREKLEKEYGVITKKVIDTKLNDNVYEPDTESE